MRIVFVAQLNEGHTGRMRMEALQRLGHKVVGINEQTGWEQTPWLSLKIQRATGVGPLISRFNESIVQAARDWKPDLLWAEKQEQIRPATLQQLRDMGVRLLHYTPDPYFTLSWKRSRHLDAALPLFDHLVTSKRYELDQYRRVGPEVVYVPFGFAEWVHRPLSPVHREIERAYASDVVFVGGWEPGRQRALEAVAATGCVVKVWGNAWEHVRDGRWTPRRAYRLGINSAGERVAFRRSESMARALQGGEVYGDAYAWALSNAKIAIGFLSGLCPDRHTTRTFEIPACGTLMLAQRTEEHLEFFEEGVDADYFSSTEELVDKVRFYLANEAARERIARSGYQRCFSSPYSYLHRVASVLSEIGSDARRERTE